MLKLTSNNAKLSKLIDSYNANKIDQISNLTEESIYTAQYDIFTKIMREVQTQQKYYDKMSNCFVTSIFKSEFYFAIIPLSFSDIKKILNNTYDNTPIINKIWILGANIIVSTISTTIRELLIRATNDTGGLDSILAQLIKISQTKNIIEIVGYNSGYTIKLKTDPKNVLFTITTTTPNLYDKIRIIYGQRGGISSKKLRSKKKNKKTRKRQKSKKNRRKSNRNKSQKNK